MDTDGVFSLADTALSPAKLALVDGHIIVGDASGEGADVAMSGDCTIANTGAVTIGAKKVTESKIALAEGKVFIGASGGAAAAQTLTGDVTVNTSGTTAIGAKKVLASMIACADGKILVGGADGASAEQTMSGDATLANTGAITIGEKKIGKAKLISEAEAVAGNIFVSTGSDYGIDEVAVSGDATLAANGALTIADSVLDGSNVANTSPDNVIGAIPVLYRIAVEDASANNDITSTHKFLVTDFWFVGGATPGVAEDTVQLLNGTNAISEVVAKTTDANCLVRATQLDQSTGMVAAGGTIRITSVKNTNVAGTAYVMGIRVA